MQTRTRIAIAPALALVLGLAAAPGCDSPEEVKEWLERIGQGGASGGGTGGASGGGSGRMCGGPNPNACPTGEFCDFSNTAPSCGRNGGGVCVKKPEACTAIYAPVCGCDGKTYGNDCARASAGVSKQHDGECGRMTVEVGEGESCEGFTPPPLRVCAKGLKCNNRPGLCPGRVADAPGVCESVPTVCTKEYAPVCGCDGKTYGNDCMRKAAGVGLDHVGECKTRPGGKEGEMCGGIAGLPCGDGLACDIAPGSCQVADAAGVCVRKFDACDTRYAPVCGCDGKTYGNDCTRIAAGVSKDHDGECKTGGGRKEGEMCGGIAGFACASGLFCDMAAGSCRVADGAGVCARRPEACTLEYAPVCGCDGRTYGNDCARRSAGVSKSHDGECRTAMPRELTPGVWGGEHAVLTARGGKAISTIEFDCAHGSIPGPLTLAPDGAFKWAGTYVREGGPEPAGGRPSIPATYHGRVLMGQVMELSLSFENATSSPFKLNLGQRPRLQKCR